MEVKPSLNISESTAQTADAYQAAHTLGELLSQTPEYQAYLEALKAVNNDSTMRKISAEMRSHQSAMRWGQEVSKHAAEVERLQAELNALPLFRKYQDAEQDVRQMFHSMDEMISQAAGVNFAANAKRGCGCGG